ncbi:putative quinol monooxygenase [Kocuria tytonis]|uniref:Antibiotic biosynthesis monooxygenase n=1 Tax=Kocuria tytonis TaxID=2054280 RepID=A0A495A5M4_9MICC|nr:putative quinol monooxygenase [Kocuria tytonis]RKQ35113.1 antibiotic biosynthesis monooxygenase [Kocuria tytonis]
MIFIVVKFEAKDEYAQRWPELVAEFTEATRREPGNKWFEWSRSLETPNEFVLVEAFEEDAAEAHVNSAHFTKMTEEFPRYLVRTPRIISRQIEGDGWEEMGEVQVSE